MIARLEIIQTSEKPPGSKAAFQCRSRSTVVLQTTRILIPSIIISLTILGLAAIYTGSCVDAQAGKENRVRIVGSEGRCE